MQILRRVVAHGLQIEAFEDIEGLDHYRPWRPESGLQDFVAVVGGAAWAIGLRVEGGEIAIGDQAAVLFREFRDTAGESAFVEIVPPRPKLCGAATGGPGLTLGEAAQ